MAKGYSGGTSPGLANAKFLLKSTQQRSLRALRRLLIAFRAAAHMNEDDQDLAWTIDSPSSKSVLSIMS